ncbi:MAG TPA: MgtC/SapB family protein [Gemmatimonadaceae bacterium]|jgi:putative Mg2+ transporter-C (MgtC) family protein|nr:MgtC/SapB family protein [Gemmatimonadaceae bacterium]
MIVPPPQASMHDMIAAFRLDLISKLALAILMGGAIGLERQMAGKASGLRTNILICLGSALIMDLSMNLGMSFGDVRVGDPGRIAAQIVTGIGFIGAGTIMQSRGTITGLTSAATIWVVAAIGMTVGAGFYVEALGATAMVMLVLAGLGRVEYRLLRMQRTHPVTVRTRPGTTLEWLKTALFSDGLSVVKAQIFDHDDDRVFELVLKGPARQFDIARAELLDRGEILNVMFG